MTQTRSPNPHAAQHYLRTRVMTATPAQLQMMLYDGAVRFCEAAKTSLETRDLEGVYVNTSRAQRIVTELLSNLKPKEAPALAAQLAALYKHVYKRLTEAGVTHNAASLDEAIDLLRYQRETWALLIQQLGEHRAKGPRQPVAEPVQQFSMSA